MKSKTAEALTLAWNGINDPLAVSPQEIEGQSL